MAGTVHRDGFFMRTYAGDATDDVTGEQYELSVGMDGSPLVYHKATRRTFSLGWKDVLRLAIDAFEQDEARPDEGATPTAAKVIG